MPEPSHQGEDGRPLFARLKSLLNRMPDDRAQLLDLLRKAHDRDLIDADAVSMIEGVLQVGDLAVRDIMVPRSQMDVVDITQPFDRILEHVIETAHSRFPVVEGDRDNVLGILHAKELLRLVADPDTDVRDLLRPPVFVPESKPLNVLLRDFRSNHNHLAIVVDEYGGTAGIVTIEDLLEEIVGEIRDEYDVESETVTDEGHGTFVFSGKVSVDEVRDRLGVEIEREGFETVGGYLLSHLGRMPYVGEIIDVDGLVFEVLEVERRRITKVRAKKTNQVKSEK